MIDKHKSNQLKSSLVRASFLLVFTWITGCTTASIAPQESNPPPSSVRPDQIVIYDFAVSAEDVKENQGILDRAYRASTQNEEQEQQAKLELGHSLAKDLADDLVKQLQGLGFNASRLPRGSRASGTNVLVLDGDFVDIDEGNRARRLIIGFGAGASKLDTQVMLGLLSSTGAQSPLLNFSTHAESGKMPGAAVTMGAGAAAQGGATAASAAASAGMSGAKIYGSMMTTLAANTSKQITAYLSQYFAVQGWISQEQAEKVKYSEKRE